jgi:hypothetical protein
MDYVSIDRCGLPLLLLVLLLSPILFLLPSKPVLISRTDGSWLGFGQHLYGELGLGATTAASVIESCTVAEFTCKCNTPTALFGSVIESCTVTALGTSDVESCMLGGTYTICKK